MKKLSLFFTAAILVFLASALPMSAGTLGFTLDKNTPQAHFDVTSGPGKWYFHIEVTGKVNSLSLPIKNSAPGAADFCSGVSSDGVLINAGVSLRQPKGTIDTDSGADVPAAACYACGRTNWSDTNGTALALVAYLQTGDRNARVTITVTFPDPLPDQPFSDECPPLP